MATAPRFTRLVESLPATIPFVGPETLERRRGEAFRIRVGANESAFGVSPKAAEAIRRAIGTIAWYNDPEGYELRRARSPRATGCGSRRCSLAPASTRCSATWCGWSSSRGCR